MGFWRPAPSFPLRAATGYALKTNAAQRVWKELPVPPEAPWCIKDFTLRAELDGKPAYVC
jgi:hypothetical protein